MQRFLYMLEHNGLAALALLAAAVGFAWYFLRRKPGERLSALAVLSGGAALFGVGALAMPDEASMWTAIACGGLLFVASLVLLISSNWSFYLGLLLGGGLCLGLGGLIARPISETIYQAVRTAIHGEFGSPWWLLVLLALPAVIYLSVRSLAGLGPVRRWIAIGLRCVLIALLALALSEIRLRKSNDSLTVMFVVDRSLSIPQEIKPDDPLKVDQRWKRTQSFIANAVLKRGTGHELDQAGVIFFGRRPRLALPPSTVDRLEVRPELTEGIDPAYTDIGGAIKLALASFSEGAAKRIVLLSDGNQNLGNAEEQARLAKLNGIQIDVVTVAAGHKNENEVLVQSVEAPPVTEQGTRLPIRVLIRSYNPRLVRGQLLVMQKSTDIVMNNNGGGQAQPTAIPVRIQAGPGVENDGVPAIVQLRPA